MKDIFILLAHLLTTIAKLLGPGGARAIVADSLLTKQQLLIINRTRRRAPKLTALDRFLMGFCSLFLLRRHIQRAAVIIQPSTLLKFHQLLKQRKYRLLYSSCDNERDNGNSWSAAHSIPWCCRQRMRVRQSALTILRIGPAIFPPSVDSSGAHLDGVRAAPGSVGF